MKKTIVSLCFVLFFQYMSLPMNFTINTTAFAETIASFKEEAVYQDIFSYCRNTHTRLIEDIHVEPMEIYSEAEETIHKEVMGSDFIPISPHDIVNIIIGNNASELDQAEYYIYFYGSDKTIDWDIFNFTNKETYERNRISAQDLKELYDFQFPEILKAAMC